MSAHEAAQVPTLEQVATLTLQTSQQIAQLQAEQAANNARLEHLSQLIQAQSKPSAPAQNIPISAHLHKPARIDRFTGTKNSIGPTEWLQQIEHCLFPGQNMSTVYRQEFLQAVVSNFGELKPGPEATRSNPRQWFTTQLRDGNKEHPDVPVFATWEAFTFAFLNKFGPANPKEHARRLIKQLAWQSGEDIDTFTARFITAHDALSTAGGQVTDDTMLADYVDKLQVASAHHTRAIGFLADHAVRQRRAREQGTVPEIDVTVATLAPYLSFHDEYRAPTGNRQPRYNNPTPMVVGNVMRSDPRNSSYRGNRAGVNHPRHNDNVNSGAGPSNSSYRDINGGRCRKCNGHWTPGHFCNPKGRRTQ
jgi:hypothetical protein